MENERKREKNRSKRSWKPKDDNNFDVVIKGLKRYGNQLVYVSENLRNDVRVVSTSLKCYGMSLELLTPEMKDNKELVVMAVRNNGCSLKFASERLKDDREVVMIAVTNRGDALEFASPRLQDDREIGMVAVSKKGLSLQFCSEELKNDEEIVKTAINQSRDPKTLSHASDRVKGNPEVVILGVSKNYQYIEYSHTSLRNNVEFFEKLITLGPYNPKYGHYQEKFPQLKTLFKLAGPKIQNDDFFERNIHKNGDLLRFAPTHLRCNKNFVIRAVRGKGCVLRFASTSLRDDKDVVIASFYEAYNVLEFASDRLKDDYEVVLESAKKSPHNLKSASDRLRDDFSLIKTAVQYHVDSLEYASDRLRENREIVMEAIKINPYTALYGSGDSVKSDRNIAMMALKKDGNALSVYSYPRHAFCDDRELVTVAIQKSIYNNNSQRGNNASPIIYASERLRGDRDLMLLSMKEYPNFVNSLHYVDHTLRRDKSFHFDVLSINGLFFKSFYPNQRRDRDFILHAVSQNSKAVNYIEDRCIYLDVPFMISLIQTPSAKEDNGYEILSCFKNIMKWADTFKRKEYNQIKKRAVRELKFLKECHRSMKERKFGSVDELFEWIYMELLKARKSRDQEEMKEDDLKQRVDLLKEKVMDRSAPRSFVVRVSVLSTCFHCGTISLVSPVCFLM